MVKLEYQRQEGEKPETLDLIYREVRAIEKWVTFWSAILILAAMAGVILVLMRLIY